MLGGKRSIAVPHGQLEAIHRAPEGTRAGAALVLHPHPLYGGTMHNPVVLHCAGAFHESGYETLRINFRGVGESTGRYDEGRGELDDARFALDHLLGETRSSGGQANVVIAGYSFGAVVALRLACADPRVSALVAVAIPAAMLDAALLEPCAKPKLFVHGDADTLAPLGTLEQLLQTTAMPADLRVVRGADHFFADEMDELRQAIAEFVGART